MLAAAFLCIAPLTGQAQPCAATPPTPTRPAIGTALLAAVGEVTPKTADIGTGARLQRIAVTTADELPPDSLVGRRLRAIAEDTAGARESEPDRARRVAGQLLAIADDLRFQPVREAATPDGWPDFTAVGDLEVKVYPAYRMARSSMRGSNSMGAFWKLFEHIQSRSIPMTAPVQVDYGTSDADEGGGEMLPAAMAFLYEDASTGSPGKDGRVDIVDVPAMTVISIGARGNDSRFRIERLREQLEAWLHANRANWRAVGPVRTMGWNSPSVRGDRRYFEVQIPVAPSL